MAEAESAGEEDLEVRPEEAEDPPRGGPRAGLRPRVESQKIREDPEDAWEIEFPEVELEIGADSPGD